MKKSYLLTILFLIIVSLACSENTENLVNGPDDGEEPGADPIGNVSYQNQVQPIFNNTCGGSNCHVGGGTNGVNLTSYSQTINSVGSRYGTEVVNPGDSNGSPLVDKIEPNPQHGSRMPLGGSLSNRQIETITVWINEGANNN